MLACQTPFLGRQAKGRLLARMFRPLKVPVARLQAQAFILSIQDGSSKDKTDAASIPCQSQLKDATCKPERFHLQASAHTESAHISKSLASWAKFTQGGLAGLLPAPKRALSFAMLDSSCQSSQDTLPKDATVSCVDWARWIDACNRRGLHLLARSLSWLVGAHAERNVPKCTRAQGPGGGGWDGALCEGSASWPATRQLLLV